jgi:hypothetical protein
MTRSPRLLFLLLVLGVASAQPLLAQRPCKFDGTDCIPATSFTVFPILAPDGSAAAPAYSFASDATLGLYRSAANVVGVSVAGTHSLSFGANFIRMGAASDLILLRRAAATFNLGAADAAAPIAQTLTVQGTTANDTAGAKFTLTGSQGKGTGSGGNIAIQTGVTAGAAATANTASDRDYFVAAPKALTSGAGATGIFEIAIPTNNTSVGYTIDYVISFADGTNYAIHKGMAFGSAYRDGAAAVTGQAPAEGLETNHNGAGSNTTDTFTVVAGAGKITISLTATKGNSVGAVTLGEVSYTVRLSGRHAGVTPL